MAWQRNRHTRSFKIVAMIVVCLFFINSIAWANPDIFKKDSTNSCLQVPSNFNPIVNPQSFHEFLVKTFTKTIVESLDRVDDFKLRLMPFIAPDMNIVLDFSKKTARGEGEWIIPCAIMNDASPEPWKYYAVIDVQNRDVALIKQEKDLIIDTKKDSEGSSVQEAAKKPLKAEAYGWKVSTGIQIEIRGFDFKTAEHLQVYAGFIFSDDLIAKRIRDTGLFSTENFRIVFYNPEHEAYRKFDKTVRLPEKKEALWIPVTDVRSAYTQIAKALWKFIEPEELEGKIEEWSSLGEEFLKRFDPEMAEKIEHCINWELKKMDPDYLFANRSMYLKLKEPIKIGKVTFRYVKIKGVTYKGIFPPASERFTGGASKGWRTTEDGKIIIAENTNILGAMTTEKAKNEFDKALEAFRTGDSAAYPIAWGVYPKIQLEEKDDDKDKKKDDDKSDGRGKIHTGGFAVMLVPDAPEMTLEEMVYDNLPELRSEVLRLKTPDRISEKAEPASEYLAQLVGEMKSFIYNHGVELRKGHDKGYFFVTPHHGNCVLFETEEGPVQRMKDFESADIIDRRSNPERMVASRFVDIFRAIQHYNNFLKLSPELRIIFKHVGFDPVRLFLEGYFSDIKDDPRVKVFRDVADPFHPFLPPLSKPVVELKHPVIELLKEVEGYKGPPKKPKKRPKRIVSWPTAAQMRKLIESLPAEERARYESIKNTIINTYGIRGEEEKLKVEYSLARTAKAAERVGSRMIFETVGYYNYVLRSPAISRDNILTVLDIIAETAEILGPSVPPGLSVIQAVARKPSVDSSNIIDVLDSLAEVFDRLKQVLGPDTDVTTNALFSLSTLADNSFITDENLIEVLNSLVSTFGEMREKHGIYTPKSFQMSYFDSPLVTEANYKTIFEKTVELSGRTKPANSAAVYAALNLMHSAELINDKNAVKVLDVLIEQLGSVSQDAGPAATYAIMIIRNVLLGKKSSITDANLASEIKKITRLISRIYSSRNSCAISSLEGILEVLRHEAVLKISGLKILGKLVRIAEVTGPASPEAFKVVKAILDKFNPKEEELEGLLDELAEAFQRMCESTGTTAGGALRLAAKVIEKPTVGSADVVPVLNSMVEPLGRIYNVTGPAATSAFGIIGEIVKKTSIMITLDLDDTLNSLVEPFSEIRRHTGSDLAAAIVFTALKENCAIAHGKNSLYDHKGVIENAVSFCRLHKARAHIKTLHARPDLIGIDLAEAGRSTNLSSNLAKDVLESVPPVYIEKPRDVPDMERSIDSLELLDLDSLARKANMDGLEFDRALGRSLVFKDPEGNELVLKLLKEKEADSVLAYEAGWFNWVGKNLDLKHDPPLPVAIEKEGEFRFRFLLGKCPEKDKILASLEEASSEAAIKTGQPLRIDPRYVAMAYRVKKSSKYTGYLKKDYEGDWGRFKSACLDAAHDLGLMAREGIVHTALADIFHNLAGGRARRYVVTADLARSSRDDFGGVGRLTAWERAVRYVNIGPDGIVRDYAELRHLSDAVQDAEFLGEDMTRSFQSISDRLSSIYLLEFFGEYALTFALVAGLWQKENGWKGIKWDKDRSLQDLAGFMNEIYLTLITSYLGEEKRPAFERIAERVDWLRLARQMAFFMSSEHVRYLDPKEGDRRKKKFPAGKIFGKNVSVYFGGFRASSWSSEKGFVGDEAELEHIKDQPALGPVNGPLVLQELITANYYMFAPAIAQAALEGTASAGLDISGQKDSSASSKAPGLIGKYQPLEAIEFIYDEKLAKYVAIFKALNIETNQEEQITLYARRAPPATFERYRVADIPEIDKALKDTLSGIPQKNRFILEPNPYGIDGIGQSNLLAVLDQISFSPIALFHEIAESAINIGILPLNEVIKNIKGGETALDQYMNEKGKEHRKVPKMDSHYALRLFQRKKWGNEDVALTGLIKSLARPVTKGKLPPELQRLVDNKNAKNIIRLATLASHHEDIQYAEQALLGFETVMKSEFSSPFDVNVAFHRFAIIAGCRPELAYQAIGAMGNILYTKGLGERVYDQIADELMYIAQTKSEYAFRCVQVLENVLLNPESVDPKAFAEAADSLFDSVSYNHIPGFSSLFNFLQNPARIIANVFKAQGVKDYIHTFVSIYATMLVKENPDDLASRLAFILAEAVEAGISDPVALEQAVSLLIIILAEKPDLLEDSALIANILKGLMHLQGIQFTDGGDTDSNYGVFLQMFLNGCPQVVLSPTPAPAPKRENIDLKTIHTYKDMGLSLKECKVVAVRGRTIIFRTREGKYLALKFLKKDENPGILKYESEMLDFIHAGKRAFGLKGEYPRARMLNGGTRVARVKGLPEEVLALFEGQKTKTGEVIELDTRYDCYTFMAYEAKSPDYFTYLSDPSLSDEDFDRACLTNLHDLFILARHGIMHTALIELFHNMAYRAIRPDQGRYLWMIDVLGHIATRGGAGRLHAWTNTVRYPNSRLSGVADFGDSDVLSNLMELGNPSSVHVHRLLNHRFEDKTVNFYLANYLGDYLLSMALIVAKRSREKDGLDWESEEAVNKLAETMKKYFDHAYRVFTGHTLGENISGTIDWQRLARQMCFFMAKGDVYAEYLINHNMPQEIYGEDVHIEYAEDYSQSRHESWKWEEDKKGWYFDGEHPDLGPVNGPIPLDELIKALYIYSGYMVAQIAKRPLPLIVPASKPDSRLQPRLAPDPTAKLAPEPGPRLVLGTIPKPGSVSRKSEDSKDGGPKDKDMPKKGPAVRSKENFLAAWLATSIFIAVSFGALFGVFAVPLFLQGYCVFNLVTFWQLIEGYIGISALILWQQSLKAGKIEKERQSREAATPDDMPYEIIEKFGPVLGPPVVVHEYFHRINRDLVITEVKWLDRWFDELLAYTLEYVLAPVAIFAYFLYRINWEKYVSRLKNGISSVLMSFVDRENSRRLRQQRRMAKEIERKWRKEFRSLTDDQIKERMDKIGEEVKREYRKVKFEVSRLRHLADKATSLKERNKYTKKLQEIKNEVLDKRLVEVFAAVMEAFYRTKEDIEGNPIRLHTEQLMGGIALHRGEIAEMITGEGKTYVAPLAVCLNALLGEGVHVVTVNDFLAKRDAELVQPVYELLGFKTGYVQQIPPKMNEKEREKAIKGKQEAYACDVTYGTNNEFGFDYLRDNRAASEEERVQRRPSFAIVDEVDNILIDEARTPLILSQQSKEKTNGEYREMRSVAEAIVAAQEELVVGYLRRLHKCLRMRKREEAERLFYLIYKADPKNSEFQEIRKNSKWNSSLFEGAKRRFEKKGNDKEREDLLSELYFTVDEKTRKVSFENRGCDMLEEMGIEYRYCDLSFFPENPEDKKLPLDTRTWINKRLYALEKLMEAFVLYHRGVEYQVEDGKVVIVDPNTGRKMEGRRWSHGLHEAVEAKEGVKVERGSDTLGNISFQNYFRMYDKLAGMTGTAKTEQREFVDIYAMPVVKIPPHKKLKRVLLPDLIARSEEEKFIAIVDEIKLMHDAGRPVLVGTTSVEKSQKLSALLWERHKIKPNVLNAEVDKAEEEARIIAQAGRLGAVTIATNMAGRGTDIKLGGDPAYLAMEEVEKRGITDPEERKKAFRRFYEEFKKEVLEERKKILEIKVKVGGKKLRGLHVIGSERHEARRIDDQLMGRAGRQGDPGSCRFFASLDDDLIRDFVPDNRMREFIGKYMGEGAPHEDAIMAWVIRGLQKKRERQHFDIRKRTLEFDSVLNQQRRVVYANRRRILQAESVKKEFSKDYLPGAIDCLLKEWEKKKRDPKVLLELVKRGLGIKINHPIDLRGKSPRRIKAYLHRIAMRKYRKAEKFIGEMNMRQLMRAAIDLNWEVHLDEMEYLREGIHWRSIAQKDPLMEFRREGFNMFREMTENTNAQIVRRIMELSSGEAPVQATFDSEVPGEAPVQATSDSETPGETSGTIKERLAAIFANAQKRAHEQKTTDSGKPAEIAVPDVQKLRSIATKAPATSRVNGGKKGARKGHISTRSEKTGEIAPHKDKKPSSGLIGKWQVTSEIRFVPDEDGSNTGFIIFRAVDIGHPERNEIEIKLRAERAPPKMLAGFRRTGDAWIDEKLEELTSKFTGETLLIETNHYGIEGIGTEGLVAVLDAFENEKIAKFHELAHALIDKELEENRKETGGEKSPFLGRLIEKFGNESETGEEILDRYLEEKADKYGISEEKRDAWKKAWRIHYAIRLFQKHAWPEEDETFKALIKVFMPSEEYPPHFPPEHIPWNDSSSMELEGSLPVSMEVISVERKGPIIEPEKGSKEFVLNAGVMSLRNSRLLFNRIAVGGPDKRGLRKSKIGLVLHDKKEGIITAIDKDMLMPKGKDIKALEDARVIERDGTIYMYLTVVKKNGRHYSAVTTHNVNTFARKVYDRLAEIARLKEIEEKLKRKIRFGWIGGLFVKILMKIIEKFVKKKINWEWTPLERLITDGPCADQNIKNFVPFANPANGKWFALYRPEERQTSTMRFAASESGLKGPWKDVGEFASASLPGFQWMGPSAYVADLPSIHGVPGFDLMIIHAAAGEMENKYYDLRVLLTDRKDPTKKSMSDSILKPEKGQPYELENGHKLWVPGVIYSCGAVLDDYYYDEETGKNILVIDVYYSGSDTAVLLATVKVAISYEKKINEEDPVFLEKRQVEEARSASLEERQSEEARSAVKKVSMGDAKAKIAALNALGENSYIPDELRDEMIPMMREELRYIERVDPTVAPFKPDVLLNIGLANLVKGISTEEKVEVLVRIIGFYCGSREVKDDKQANAIRQEAFRLLNELGEDVIPAIAKLLQAEDWNLRGKAAECLGQLEGASKFGIPLLREALNNEDSVVRLNAAEALAHLAGEKAIEPVWEAFLRENHSYYAEIMIRRLAEVIGEDEKDFQAVYDRFQPLERIKEWLKENKAELVSILGEKEMAPLSEFSKELKLKRLIQLACLPWWGKDFYHGTHVINEIWIDREGRFWYYKPHRHDQGVGHEDRNNPWRELVAWNIGKGSVNTAEIKVADGGEAHFRRMSVSYKPSELCHADPVEANSALLVYLTLLRKWDEKPDQRAPVEDSFVSFDHDMAFCPDYLNIDSFAILLEAYLSTDAVHGQVAKRMKDKFMTVDRGAIGRSIKEFKALDMDELFEAIKAEAIESASPAEIDDVMDQIDRAKAFLKETQATLEEDVNKVIEEVGFKVVGEETVTSPEVEASTLIETAEEDELLERIIPLRDLTKLEQVASNLVEMVVSGILTKKDKSPESKKLVLAFDKNIMSKRALAVFRGLQKLKTKPKYRKLLGNLEIIIEPTESLPGALKDYAGKEDAVVFMFAEENARENLDQLESIDNVEASYIKMEGEWPPDYYYPLAEIVTMTLANYVNKGCFNGFTEKELEGMNIASRPKEENGALIFIIIPKIKRYDPNHQMDRYVLLKRYLTSA